MPIQTNSQRVGALGQSIVELQVKRSGRWVSRNLTEDYGVDLEIEYAPEEVKANHADSVIFYYSLVRPEE